MRMRCLVAGLAIFLAGCAVTPPEPAVDIPQLRLAAAGLPAAELSTGEPLTISYTDGGLFGRRAALPLPGGPEVLDPLAALLADFPAARWQAVVRAESGLGEAYDRRLAETRRELLERYLLRKGVAAGQIDWQVKAAAGASLELVLKKAAVTPG